MSESLDSPEAQSKIKREQEERTRLVDELRLRLLRNPEAKLDIKDIITEDILKLSNEELKNAIRNIDYYNRNQSSLLNAKSFLKGLNNLVEFASDDQLTIETAPEDKDLQKDVENFVFEYFGHVPVLGRIMIRLGSHLNYKKHGAKEGESEKK